MKRIVYLGFVLCIALLGFAYAEENSDCLCMTDFLPDTVPNLVCSAYTIDPAAAMDVLMNAPYLTKNTEKYHMGTGWSNDDEEMAIGPKYIIYRTRLGKNLENLVEAMPSSFLNWNGGAATELSFGSVDEIVPLAKDFLEKLDIHAELVHALAYDEAALRAAIPDAFRAIDEEKIEECYTLFFCCTENDLRLSVDGYYSDLHGMGMGGSEVMVIWTRNGLQLLDAYGLYHIDEEVENSQSLLSPEAALNAIRDDYELYKTLHTHSRLINARISHQRLVYARVPISGVDPNEGYALIPAWLFTQEQQWNISMEPGGYELSDIYSDYTLIDARTGEEL